MLEATGYLDICPIGTVALEVASTNDRLRQATADDQSGRVVGVDSLRVIDASIIPACPRANTVLTVIMLAEKLAAELAGSGLST